MTVMPLTADEIEAKIAELDAKFKEVIELHCQMKGYWRQWLAHARGVEAIAAYVREKPATWKPEVVD